MESPKCPTCGASMKAWWHSMSPNYVNTLVKLLITARQKNQNHVFLKEANLTNNEYSNISKLRFFALIAKYKTPEGVHKDGWLITHLGGEFLAGRAMIPDRVKTFRNRIIEKSDNLISIHDVMRKDPTWPQTFEYQIMRVNKP